MKTLRCLTPEEFTAVQHAAFMHGRNFKTAIRTAWVTGGYRREMIEDYSGTLQRMRNSADGHALLDSLRTVDFVPNKATAYLMGKNAVREGGSNPFGVATLAKQWRNGYADALAAMPPESRPISSLYR